MVCTHSLDKYQPVTNPFLNPFNWVKFFNSLKDKDNEEKEEAVTSCHRLSDLLVCSASILLHYCLGHWALEIKNSTLRARLEVNQIFLPDFSF